MIEKKVLKEIEALKREYLKKDKEFKAEREKLLELEENYVAENNVILPHSRLKDRLDNYLYDLEFEEKQQPVQEEEQGNSGNRKRQKDRPDKFSGIYILPVLFFV